MHRLVDPLSARRSFARQTVTKLGWPEWHVEPSDNVALSTLQRQEQPIEMPDHRIGAFFVVGIEILEHVC